MASQMFAGFKRVIDGMCGTNQNGNVCYKVYGDVLEFTITEFLCDFQFRESGECICNHFSRKVSLGSDAASIYITT